MTSALVIWNYHRKLSLGSVNNDEQRDIQEKRRRTLSQSSGGQLSENGRGNRRDSEDSEDEMENVKSTEEKPKPRRRFSLDFLFSRKSKKGKKKEKTQRTQSVSESSCDEPAYKPYKYPSMSGAEYALAM